MEELAASLASAIDTGWDRITALAVTYAFSVVGAIIILVLGIMAASLVRRWVASLLGRIRGVDRTLTSFISNAARYGVLVIVGVTVLSQFGVQTASIIAALGAAGLAIGLALQGTLQNIAAGLMLLILRPFKAGEYVEAGSIAGTIEEIGLFATQLRTVDGLFVLTPNSELWSSPVTNFSRNAQRRFDLVVGIGYDDDINHALDTMKRLVSADSRVLDNPEPYYFVSELGDSAVGVTARFWTDTADYWTTSRDLTKAVKNAFDEAGISIPYPQQSVHYLPTEARA